MIAETGHYALILALGVAIVQTMLPLLGARLRDPQLAAVAAPAAQMQFILIAIAFIALTTAYVTSDFSIENVWRNSHSAKPLLYKISGVWGNHEGSMVLWVLILALFGASVATYGTNLPRQLKANVLAVQGSIAAAFLLFIVTTSNPFTRLSPAPFDGQGLNPVLQDPALSFHPPFLYAGYVGFSMAFSFAVAALIEGRIDAAWARWVRPWTLAAWMCLTLGIAMGSWWAYYELGWGGFWFWDPVENASFMPWLAGTALLHSALVMEKRDALKVWTILLAIITFSLSLMGTFLVRSGVLTSVHAFAVDPARGIFILALFAVMIGGALALYAWRTARIGLGGEFAPVSRESLLLANNVLLLTAAGSVLLGTLYPLFLDALALGKISVGPPYFEAVFVPLMSTEPTTMLMVPSRSIRQTALAGSIVVGSLAGFTALAVRGDSLRSRAAVLGAAGLVASGEARRRARRAWAASGPCAGGDRGRRDGGRGARAGRCRAELARSDRRWPAARPGQAPLPHRRRPPSPQRGDRDGPRQRAGRDRGRAPPGSVRPLAARAETAPAGRSGAPRRAASPTPPRQPSCFPKQGACRHPAGRSRRG